MIIFTKLQNIDRGVQENSTKVEKLEKKTFFLE